MLHVCAQTAQLVLVINRSGRLQPGGCCAAAGMGPARGGGGGGGWGCVQLELVVGRSLTGC